jgi:hypothetical protein
MPPKWLTIALLALLAWLVVSLALFVLVNELLA